LKSVAWTKHPSLPFQDAYKLAISDNGIGLPQCFIPSSSRALGMTLIHGFSAQLGAALTITGTSGLRIKLVFAEEQHSVIHSSVLSTA